MTRVTRPSRGKRAGVSPPGEAFVGRDLEYHHTARSFWVVLYPPRLGVSHLCKKHFFFFFFKRLIRKRSANYSVSIFNIIQFEFRIEIVQPTVCMTCIIRVHPLFVSRNTSDITREFVYKYKY